MIVSREDPPNIFFGGSFFYKKTSVSHDTDDVNKK